nr:Gfo/Idh/MocA family oxidoreductase [uncultured Enterobacter sp.]
MDSLNAAIIGGGAIHTCHAEALRQTPGVTLRALVEIDADKGAALAARYGCGYYADYRDVLRDPDIDVVHICTPHYLHREMILAALAAGKQVFCEKPVGMTMADVAAISQAARTARGQLGVCYQNRYNPTSQEIIRRLREPVSGAILGMKASLTWCRHGDYYRASGWRGRFATEGGSLLINQAIHTLDLMQWFGGGVARLKGVTDSTLLADVTENEDSAMATLEFRQGATGVFHASNCYSTDASLLLELHCENETLRLEDNTLWQVVEGKRTALVSDTPPAGEAKSCWGDGHSRAIRAFYAALRNPQRHTVIGIDDAARSLAIVEAIQRSSQLRRWVTL